MKSDYFYYFFIAFIFLRFFLNGIFLTIHTLIVFSVPLIYIVYNKHYHIFKFDINDTLQSVLFNFIFSFIMFILILAGAAYFGNLNWVNIFDIPYNFILLLLLLSFNYELLIRYFFQNFFIRRFGGLIGVIIPSLIGGLILLPDFLSSITFFISGLFFGFIFSKTNDIYGISFGGLIIRMAISVLA
jgi:membrane protease YdiL (CAAX protease family)